MRTLAGKGVRRLGGTKILRIEISVHQYFGVLQNKRAVEIVGRFHLDYASDVLPEIVYEFPFRRANDLFDGQSLRRAHGLTYLRHERLFAERDSDGRKGL